MVVMVDTWMEMYLNKVKDSVNVNAIPDENNMSFNSRLCAG